MSKVLVTQSKIEDIADRIRAKTNISGNISLEQIKIDIAGAPSQITEGIPSYIQTEARRLAEVVKTRQESCTNYVSFIAVSDIHHSGATDSLNVLKHCAMGAYLVKKYVPIDFGIMLGDFIRGSSSDTEETSKEQYLDVLDYFSSFVDLSTQGNHDSGMGWWDGFLNYTDLYNRISRFARNPVRPSTNSDRGYYYYDVPNKNFRVIVLNTNDIKGMEIKQHSMSGGYFDGHRFSMTQLSWLQTVLTNIPSGYSFIVCSHEPIHWGDSTYTDTNNITWECKQMWRELLDAYVTGSSYSITLDNETLSGTFAGINGATLVGTFHGHTHNFIQGTYGNGNIIRLGTPNACNGRTNEYALTSYSETFRQNFGELDEQGNRVTTYFKTSVGTTNETAFVVNTIDLDNGIIYSDYYGAGHNRVVNYVPLSQYIITNNLTNITTSNNSTTIDENDTYTATLTPNTNYEISSITITMRGNDVTSTVYNSSTGVINIPQVTGDIIITAVAIFSSNYVPIVGYTDGIRWSAGDGTSRSASGYVGVNEITFDRSEIPVTFRLSGINWSKDGNCILVLTDNSAFKSATYMNSTKTDNNVGYSIQLLVNGEIDITIFQGTNPAYNGVNGFKVSGYGTGANAVITRIS